MIEIKIHNPSDEALDKALKKLKKIMKNEGIIDELKERRYYTPPSELRHLKQKQLARYGKHKK